MKVDNIVCKSTPDSVVNSDPLKCTQTIEVATRAPLLMAFHLLRIPEFS